MTINDKTETWFSKTFDVDIEGLSIDEVQQKVREMLRTGEMSPDQYVKFVELTTDDSREKHRKYIQSLFQKDGGKHVPSREPTLEEQEAYLVKKYGLDKPGYDPYQLTPTGETNMSTADLQKLMTDDPNVWGGGDYDEHQIRVKGAGERYDTKRRVMKHARWDTPIHPVRNGSVSATPVESMTQLEYAKIGAYFRHKAAKAGMLGISLTEHDRALLNESWENDVWLDDSGDKTIRHTSVKALIDDATSGGENLVPEYFDNAIVTFPLLHSEILPWVDVVDIPRGSAVETASIDNPTVVWNNAEGNAQSLFDTDDLVAAITASIFPVAVYLQAGRDLLADASPAMVGATIMQNMSEKLSQELDKVIVNGDGSTQPEGILQASSVTDVPSASGTSGPVLLDDLLDLMFAIGKQYRTPARNPRFAMTDQTYKAHRAVATGVTGDDRLLHGMSVQNYTLLESPVSIENEGMDLQHGIFGAFTRYRLWRRTGFNTRIETGGQELVRSNTVLLYGRGRYGGKVVDPSAFAVIDDWPTPLP